MAITKGVTLSSIIKDSLRHDGRINAINVDVAVENACATLHGTVSNFWEKRIAEENALNILGIHSVDNQLQVAPPPGLEGTANVELKERVLKSLSSHPELDRAKINVEVVSRQVILEGAVASVKEKRDIENAARQTKGVHGVHNKLVIVAGKNREHELIAMEIMEMLDQHEMIDAKDVDIIVDANKVVLSGTTPSWSAKNAVLNMATYPLGVFDVVDNLKVARKGKPA